MNGLSWDEHAVADFFAYQAAHYEMEDDEGRIFSASDGSITAKLVVLPNRRIVGFSLWDSETDELVVDVAIVAHSRLDRRTIGGIDSLYCHQCVVVPGIHSYRALRWHTFLRYLKVSEPVVSVQFAYRPKVKLRFFDPQDSDRAY